MTPGRRRIAVWCASIAALALLTFLRIYLVDHLHDQGWFAKYIVFGDAILSGHIPRARLGDVSPLYLWTMVVLRACGLGVRAIRDLQIVMLSAAALLCALAARRLGGAAAAFVAAILILGNRAALILATELEPETLILLLVSAAILVAVRIATGETARRREWALLGLLIGLSAVARPVALAALILIAAYAWWRGRGRALLALSAGAFVPLAAVIAVNGALTGSLFIMQPGSQFYEGNNPLATGCAGVLPRIVADLDAEGPEPDYLHVAYRIIASRALQQRISPKLSNRYWSGKALAFFRDYPRAAASLFGWKALLSIHHYDIYDLVTTRRKSLELSRYPAIPFGVSFVLTLVALALRRRRRDLIPLVLFAIASVAALVLFNVSARQRNALLAPLAVAGAAGVAEVIALARAKNEKALYAFAFIMVITPILGIEGTPMREDDYNWWAALRSADLQRAAQSAHAGGEERRALEISAAASVLDIGERPSVEPPMLAATALATAQRASSPERRFDAAVALEKATEWRAAAAVLSTLAGYQPRRENRAVSSVSFYRARAAIHLGAPAEVVQSLLDDADAEAHGDANVLALRAVTFDPHSARLLDELYDPFTRDYALALAMADVGRLPQATALLESLEKRFPEWRRPHEMLGRASSPR